MEIFMLVKIKTESGFKCEVDDRVATNWRTLEHLKDISSGDNGKILFGTFNLAESILGKDGLDALVKWIEDRNEGYASVDNVSAEITEILNKLSNGKNSKSSPE